MDLSDVGHVKGSCLWSKLKIIDFKITTNDRGMQYVRFWKWWATTLLYINNLVFTFFPCWRLFSNGSLTEKQFYLFLKSRTKLHILRIVFALIWEHFDKRKPNYRRDPLPPHSTPCLQVIFFKEKNMQNVVKRKNIYLEGFRFIIIIIIFSLKIVRKGLVKPYFIF